MFLFPNKVTGFLHGIKYDVEIACAIIYAVCIFYSCVGGIKVNYFLQLIDGSLLLNQN